MRPAEDPIFVYFAIFEYDGYMVFIFSLLVRFSAGIVLSTRVHLRNLDMRS